MKKWLLLFAVLTLVNAVIFLSRDHFRYIHYATYDDLYRECKEDCVRKWDDFLLPYPKTSITEARILLNGLPFDSSTTLANLKILGSHLYGRFHGQAGYPGDAIHFADPLAQYQILSSDTSQKLWCGTWAQLFSFFGWTHQLVIRTVEIFDSANHHVLNECYLPERKQWVMVDLTGNIVLASKANRLLNVQEFIGALSHPEVVSVLTGNGEWVPLNQMKEWSFIKKYYQPAYSCYYYHLTKASVVYSTTARIKRYFLPESWYEVYSKEKRFPVLFCIKLFFIVAWLITGSLPLVKGIYDRSKRYTEKLWQ